MRMKKSQAALEFLMTYGWAILVVLVAIGALAYFGVLSPDKFLPEKCQFPAGLACNDFKIRAATDDLQIVVRNSLGSSISAAEFTIVDPNNADAVICATSGAQTFNNGEQKTIKIPAGAGTCSPALTAGNKFGYDILVTYTNDDSGLTGKSIRGSITGRVGP
tara:strand:- start:336 stop:821 length:486 start_codon:yes stop_codon:yes gene_type:complete